MDLKLETITTSTLFGVRFWDPARDVQVADSLAVTARPSVRGSTGVTASVTASGIYTFQGLPGMRDIENRSMQESFSAAPHEFIIEVDDRQRRFLPMSFTVSLPLGRPGLYLPMGSPPGDEHHRFFLFSAPTRFRHSGMAVIRGSLTDNNSRAGAPAAHAFIEVEVAGERWYGIADTRGEVAVLFPYPVFTEARGGSPPGLPPAQQEWGIVVRVFYQPRTLRFPPGSATPDLVSIFHQNAAQIIDRDGISFSTLHPKLSFGQELVLRSGTGSELCIAPS